jgi:hypothetical protein
MEDATLAIFVYRAVRAVKRLLKELGRNVLALVLIVLGAALGGLIVLLFVNLISLAGLLGLIWPLLAVLTFILYALKSPEAAMGAKNSIANSILEEAWKYVAYFLVGLTPQFVFLIVLNWQEGEYSGWIERALRGYEWFAVEAYEHAESINDAAWYWWLLAIASVAIASWILKRPWIFRFGNQLREVLSTITFVSVVACSFVISTNNVATTNSRLRITFSRSVHHAVEEALGQELRKTVESEPHLHSSIPTFVENFKNVQVKPVLTEDGIESPNEDDMREARSEVLRSTVKIDVKDSVEGNGTQPADRDGESLLGVYTAEKASRKQGADLEEKAHLVKESVIAFAGQKVPVPDLGIPLAQEILNDLFSMAAENLTNRVLERLPVREGVAAGDKLGTYIKQRVVVHYDKVVFTLLNPPLVDRLRGRDGKTDIAELLRERSEILREKVRDKMMERLIVTKAVREAVRKGR